MALKKNVIYIYFKGKHLVTSKSQYQYNHGQFLYFADLDLPQTFEVHFSNTDEGYAKPQIGSNRLVEIPDAYFWTKSSQIYAWIYLHEGTTDGETKYEVIINLERRSEPVYEEILPTQQTTIERAIAELNNAVDVTTENANKTGEDRTQVSNIKDEIVDLKEDIDANAELATEKAQEAVNASLRSEASAQNAAEYESNAHGYSSEAKDYAQQTLESKTIASQKATIATDASVETLGYRDETLVAKNDVLNLRQNVIDYKNETKGYLDETKEVRADVQDIDNEVKDYASQVQASATSASQSATASANSASASAQSANEAQSASTNAETYALNSGNKAVESAQSASASANSASQAQGYAQTASAKAQDASTSAQTASQKATEASQSASQALSYKTDAESAKTASQTAQGLAESARDTAVSAKTDAESARDDAVQAKEDAESAVASIADALDDKAPIITDTASGSIASFSDGADDLPLKSLVVDINPVQDLHGQDSPYPAGGGKNEFDPSVYSAYLQSDGKYRARASQINPIQIPIPSSLLNTPCTFSFYADMTNAGTLTNVFTQAVVGGVSKYGNLVQNGSIGRSTVTFTPTSESDYIHITFGSNGANEFTFYNIQLEASSAVTDYAPYSNICPISGWTGANVYHSGADTSDATTYSITFPSEAGTVYGGKLDVLSGDLAVYPYYASYNGETLTGEWISDRDKYVSGTTPTIGAQVVNIGAQGVTVQLEPHEVESLYGVNNLWADSGDTEVEYRADTKLYIAKKIAEAIASITQNGTDNVTG